MLNSKQLIEITGISRATRGVKSEAISIGEKRENGEEEKNCSAKTAVGGENSNRLNCDNAFGGC